MGRPVRKQNFGKPLGADEKTGNQLYLLAWTSQTGNPVRPGTVSNPSDIEVGAWNGIIAESFQLAMRDNVNNVWFEQGLEEGIGLYVPNVVATPVEANAYLSTAISTTTSPFANSGNEFTVSSPGSEGAVTVGPLEAEAAGSIMLDDPVPNLAGKTLVFGGSSNFTITFADSEESGDTTHNDLLSSINSGEGTGTEDHGIVATIDGDDHLVLTKDNSTNGANIVITSGTSLPLLGLTAGTYNVQAFKMAEAVNGAEVGDVVADVDRFGRLRIAATSGNLTLGNEEGNPLSNMGFTPGVVTAVAPTFFAFSWIVRQMSTRKFRVTTDGIDQHVVKLVNGLPQAEGEACLPVVPYGTMGADVEYAQTIHNNIVKTFEGNIYSWVAGQWIIGGDLDLVDDTEGQVFGG